MKKLTYAVVRAQSADRTFVSPIAPATLYRVAPYINVVRYMAAAMSARYLSSSRLSWRSYSLQYSFNPPLTPSSHLPFHFSILTGEKKKGNPPSRPGYVVVGRH